MTVKRATNATALPTLTTPTTLQALRTWLQSLDVLASGAETSAAVTTTTTTITVA